VCSFAVVVAAVKFKPPAPKLKLVRSYTALRDESTGVRSIHHQLDVNVIVGSKCNLAHSDCSFFLKKKLTELTHNSKSSNRLLLFSIKDERRP
jgi:hypothetical protein